jgi:acetyl-CoA C-acetyltransferase
VLGTDESHSITSVAGLPDSTPVIVGVGQVSERIGEADYRRRSPAELGADAALAALTDAGVSAEVVDVIAATRQFENAMPMAKAPLGRSDNYPRSVAARIGAQPSHAILDVSGGQSPQHLVTELAGSIAHGERSVALVVGAEAMSTVADLIGKVDDSIWTESIGGQLEDRGYGLSGLLSQLELTHGLTTAAASYALCENDRRRRTGMTTELYRRQLGELFSAFSAVAVNNVHSAAPTFLSPEELVTESDRNRMIADPYTRFLVSRDKVNQGAACLLMSVAAARELGVAPDRWVFLHGHADLAAPSLLQRPELGKYPAGAAAVRHALEIAGIQLDDIDAFDLYSCFPIPVLALCDELGLAPNDERGFTLTGGLPFFGGAGNNYSLHAIGEAVEFARREPGRRALITANGGVMSKCSVGIYSSEPARWRDDRSKYLQDRLDELPKEQVVVHPDGEAMIESYTVSYTREGAVGIVVGRLEHGGGRFLATSTPDDDAIIDLLTSDAVFEMPIHVRSFGWGNRVTTAPEEMDIRFPPAPRGLRDDYEGVSVHRDGHLLEVTIDRPEVRNALSPETNAALEHVFDAFFDDDELWVAILTGAGDSAFSAGADLGYGATGKRVWVPKSGFGGLTNRVSLPKPVIAAVNGFALGGGFEIALACHLVVADETAKFGLTEVRIGVLAGAGGLVRLPRAIPPHLANELILTGRKIDATELARHGVISRLAPRGTALEVARDLAREILEVSPTSVRLSLAAMQAGQRINSVIEAIDAGIPAIDDLMSSADMMEGIAAFAQKRKPEWKNR